MTGQVDAMMAKMGLPGMGGQLKGMIDQFSGTADKGGEAAMAGLGGLMAALGGSAAAGTATAADMIDSLTGKKVASTTVEDNARLMIRAMIQAAKADGEIDPDEQKKIMEHLKDAGAEEVAFVKAQLAAPLDVDGLARDTGENAKAQVYATSLMAIRVDNTAEAQYLNALARGLGLSPEAQDRIHKAMGLA
jgi:uncharacterized membrane protein YebE (DUF533 family)